MPSDNQILHVVGAAILRGPTCLVTQRGADGGSAAEKWEFPGGKVEPGEDPRAALVREIAEELGLEIEAGAWLGRGEHRDAGLTIVLDVFAATVAAGTLHLTEHRRHGWLRAEEIDALDWAAADQPVLPAVKRLLFSRQRRLRSCTAFLSDTAT